MRSPLEEWTSQLFTGLLLALLAFQARAEVIAINPVEQGMFIGSAPSMTMYWPGKDARAVLIFIPGGDGYVGLKPGQAGLRGQLYQTLRRLSDPARTAGAVDVVVLDSPAPLSPNQRYPAARGGSDHLVRILSAVLYYRQKTGLPVWLMGHSNGGISLAEFVKYLQKEGKTGLVRGIIASGIRWESRFEPPLPFAMLFMHHRNDGCASTSGNASLAIFNKVRENAGGTAEFAWITSGDAEPADPCWSGHHMYFNAGDEVAKVLDEFLSKHR